MRRRGFAVATMDWRGQGGSTRPLKNPLKGHVESFAQYDADVATFMSDIVLPDCPPPYYCLAHSMGGHLVLRQTQSKACWWDRIVLTAPMIAFAGSEPRNAAVSVMAEIATFCGLGDSFIPGSGAMRRTHRSRGMRSPRTGCATSAPAMPCWRPHTLALEHRPWAGSRPLQLHRGDQLAAFMESIKVPVLIVAAGNDRIVSTLAIERFASRIKNCTHIVLAGAQHEILQERDQLREQFWAAFDAYIPGSGRTLRGAGQTAIAL